MHDFIEGQVVGLDGVTDKVLAQLAELVGILHRSRPEIAIPNPFVERFDIVFEGELARLFDELKHFTSRDRVVKQRLRDILLPRKDEILNHLGRLIELQTWAKRADRPMVICHTDLHGENLMLDDRGKLYLLDWENAMIAPPEHDVFFFAAYDSFWDVFLPAYEQQFGPVGLEPELLGLYYYRRGLEDLTEWMVRILQGGGSEAQDQADLEEISGCLAGLLTVEMTVGQIREKLKTWRIA